MTIVEEKKAPEHLKTLVAARINHFRRSMIHADVDAAIITRPENVFYFSGFNPIITSHAPYFVITDQDAFLLVHAIRYQHAVNESAVDRVECYGRWGAAASIADNAYETLRILLKKENLTIGLEADYASINTAQELQQDLRAGKIKDISRDILNLRLIKDSHEIEMCRISGELVDLGVMRTIQALEDGASEAQAATEGQYAMRQLWHKKYQRYEVSGFASSETAAIDTLAVWCMSNERLNYGCDCPTGYIPQSGDITMPMSWARVGGYNVENERTVLVGQVDGQRRSAYDAMLRSRDEIFSRLRPGTVFEDLYAVAMAVYEDAGFGAILPGRCGHGMGLSSHEFPSITQGNKMTLLPGMVFTVEPGLMSQDLGAVRHSDTVLITQSGFECLTKAPNGILQIKP